MNQQCKKWNQGSQLQLNYQPSALIDFLLLIRRVFVDLCIQETIQDGLKQCDPKPNVQITIANPISANF